VQAVPALVLLAPVVGVGSAFDALAAALGDAGDGTAAGEGRRAASATPPTVITPPPSTRRLGTCDSQISDTTIATAGTRYSESVARPTSIRASA
jgi:hypothetical protein